MPSWSRVSAICCCALAAGCGGSTSVADRANAVCRDHAFTIRDRAHALAALHEVRLGALVRALREEADDARWLRVAVASGDTELGMSATNLGRRAAARARAQALAVDARDCA
jgi:hypothetical protein